jgi:ribosome recycling factor
VRNARRDQNDLVKKAEKDKLISEDESKKIQTEIQNMTDKFIKEIDTIIVTKEKEVLSI